MNASDDLDRLGLERFDAVAVPDQWEDIVRRGDRGAVSSGPFQASARHRGWYLAAAASVVALLGGLVLAARVSDDATTPIDRPSADGVDRRLDCGEQSDLDDIKRLLSSGQATYDYNAAPDLDTLLSRSEVVVRGELTSAVRVPSALGGSFTSVTMTSTSVLAGDPSQPVDGFESSSLWVDLNEPDPLAERVTFDHLEVIVFLSSWVEAPSGWMPDIEGWIVACDAGPAIGVVVDAPSFLDLRSLDAIEALVTGIDPAETASTTTVSDGSADTTSTVPQGAADDRWNPSCTDLLGTGETSTPDTGLGEFGPIGLVPGLDIAIPGYAPGTQSEITPNVAISRIDGGIVVLARPYEGEDVDAYLLTVVDDDGTVRWRRCGRDAWAGTLLAAPGGSRLVIAEYPSSDPTDLVWRTFDVMTGEGSDVAGIASGLDQVVIDGRFAIFTIADDRVTTSADEFAVLDLEAGQVEMVPYPPESGALAFEQEFDVEQPTGDGLTVLARPTSDRSLVSAVFTDGGWQTEADAIAAAAGVIAVNSFDERGWEGRDGLGNVVWARPELLDIRQEGFSGAESGPTTIINACTEQTDSGCVGGAMFGVETATGEILWQRAGLRGAAAWGDGFAIIVNDAGDGWEMIDTLTGALADGSQQWAGIETFEQACCGAGDFIWVGRDGGVVFAVTDDRIRVWYPQGRAGDTIVTTLLG